MNSTTQQPKMIEIIAHIIPEEKSNHLSGMTVYATHLPGDSFIYVATSICSVDDQYSKKIGFDIAKSNMTAGAYITLPIFSSNNRKKMKHSDVRNLVKAYFGWI